MNGEGMDSQNRFGDGEPRRVIPAIPIPPGMTREQALASQRAYQVTRAGLDNWKADESAPVALECPKCARRYEVSTDALQPDVVLACRDCEPLVALQESK